MWKPNQPGSTPQSPEQLSRTVRPLLHPAGSSRLLPVPTSAPTAQSAAADQATIGKSLVVKGEVTGSESLYIDGKVEGAINLPGNRVTVGRNGQVAANISAREIVVLGKVRGNMQRQRPRRHPQRRLADRRRHRAAHLASKTAPSSRAASTSASPAARTTSRAKQPSRSRSNAETLRSPGAECFGAFVRLRSLQDGRGVFVPALGCGGANCNFLCNHS